MFVSASAEGTNVASLKQFHVASPSRGPGFQGFHLRITLRWSLKTQCSIKERSDQPLENFWFYLKQRAVVFHVISKNYKNGLQAKLHKETTGS